MIWTKRAIGFGIVLAGFFGAGCAAQSGAAVPRQSAAAESADAHGAGCPCKRGGHGKDAGHGKAGHAGHGKAGHGAAAAGGHGQRGGGCAACGGHAAEQHGGPDHQADMGLFHYLLDHRAQIRREVKLIPDGVETITESDDPEVAQGIRDHVQAMRRRMEEGRPIHARDPLFAAVFQHADEIAMQVTPTEKGVRVVETSSAPQVVKLIQTHAAVVSLFLQNGRPEMHRDHPVPAAAP